MRTASWYRTASIAVIPIVYFLVARTIGRTWSGGVVTVIALLVGVAAAVAVSVAIEAVGAARARARSRRRLAAD